MINAYLYKRGQLSQIGIDEVKCPLLAKSRSKLWVDIHNPTPEELQKIKDIFGIKTSTIHDIVSRNARTKYIEFDEYTYIVFKCIKLLTDTTIEFYNMFFIDGECFIISVHFEDNDSVNRLHLKQNKTESLLSKGEDYILHYVLDKEVDKYVDAREKISEDLSRFEQEFMEKSNSEMLKTMFRKEKLILEFRLKVDSLTNVCLMLQKPTDNFITNSLIPYFTDVYNHIHLVNQGLRLYLERINAMRNTYLSLTSNKLNQSIQVLSILMALMMPLSIVTGFFGMNVKLPLQENIHAYEIIAITMLFILILMFYLFKKFGWIGSSK